jgi:hypothetical protein
MTLNDAIFISVVGKPVCTGFPTAYSSALKGLLPLSRFSLESERRYIHGGDSAFGEAPG